MDLLFLTLSALGLFPLAVGLWRLNAAPAPGRAPIQPGSILLCALAFNLTFFWQELWLVIPKALTPGLHPVLFHNNHDWTGDRPVAELLQGTGAIATLAGGLIFLALLAKASRVGPTWRMFLFWMALQGLTQALTQVIIGAMAPGNDVGRALTYLHVAPPAKAAVFGAAILSLGLAGAVLARAYPRQGALTRAFGLEMVLTAIVATALVTPFRMPRNVIEVAVVPMFINLIGVGWLVLGAALTRREGGEGPVDPVRTLGPAVALILLLAAFQLILRPGVAFG